MPRPLSPQSERKPHFIPPPGVGWNYGHKARAVPKAKPVPGCPRCGGLKTLLDEAGVRRGTDKQPLYRSTCVACGHKWDRPVPHALDERQGLRDTARQVMGVKGISERDGG